jgi:DeoR family transcriptional regulator of aga operon/DeoR family fructose operon transcriptional repressor
VFALIQAERHKKIQTELVKNGFVSVSELSERLGISVSTVRRDLIDLEKMGIAVRSRGGAGQAGHELAIVSEDSSRATRHAEQKQKIGAKAAEIVENSGCIVLDAGTTTLEVAKRLRPKKPLRVITDGLQIAYELRDRENVIVLLTGGILKPDFNNLYGEFAEKMLSNMHAQICVMGAIGLSQREGLTKHDIDALPVRRKMIEISHKLICVADSSKLDVTGLVTICPIERINTLITDNRISSEYKDALEEVGIEVIIADS